MVVIKHVPGLFFIPLASGERAFLRYSLDGEVLVIEVTYTPASHRGQGLAEALTREVIGYAMDNRWKIRPLCSYAVQFFHRHPEYRDAVESAAAAG